MTPDEVLAAVTINAALALGLADEIGSLESGKQADLVVWNVPTSRQIPYWPAADLVRTVVKRGRIVLDRRRLDLAARLQEHRRHLGRQLRDRDRQLGLDDRLARPSRGGTSRARRLVSGASSSSGIGTTIFGSSWATSSAAFCGVSAPPSGHAGDVDRPDVAELLLRQQVADLAEVDRVHPVELDHECSLLPALVALRVVAVRPDAGEEDVADLVLARAIEDERRIERRRQERRCRPGTACPWPSAAVDRPDARR